MNDVCYCIKGKDGFLFLIEDISCSKVLYTDLSTWMTDSPYIIPESYEIEVGLSDSSTLKKVEVFTNKVTDLTEILCKDGIYKIVVKSCQHTYSHFVAVQSQLKCCLDTYMASNDYDVEKATEINRLIKLAAVNARAGRVNESKNYYNDAKRAIEKLNCDCHIT